MKALRLGSVLALLTIATVALAMPSYKATFLGLYKAVPAGSPLAKALSNPSTSCTVCHTSVPSLNKFGADIKGTMAKLKVKAVTSDVLKAVESMDSDADGVKNIDEIKAGTLPGDPKSKPADAPKPADPPAKPADAPSK